MKSMIQFKSHISSLLSDIIRGKFSRKVNLHVLKSSDVKGRSQTIVWQCLSVFATIAIFCNCFLCSCSDNDETSNLPALKDKNDVCSSMVCDAFKKYCYNNFDADHNGKISQAEADAMEAMDIQGTQLPIYDLTGIEYFHNVKEIQIKSDATQPLYVPATSSELALTLNIPNMNRLDITKSYNLVSLNMLCNLSALDVSGNKKLSKLYVCSGIDTIDLHDNTALTDLYLGCPNLSALDVSSNTELKSLTLIPCKVANVDLSNNSQLRHLDISDINFTKPLNLSANSQLTFLKMKKCSNLGDMDLSKNTQLDTLNFTGNNIAKLDLSHNNKLRSLHVDTSDLMTVNAAQCRNISEISYWPGKPSQLKIYLPSTLLNVNWYETGCLLTTKGTSSTEETKLQRMDWMIFE
jgi:hypothetical protein